MAQVIDTMYKEYIGWGYRKVRFSNKYIIQICIRCQDWDTNTGMNDGPEYEKWVDAQTYHIDELPNLKFIERD